ncbi:gem-associated protein 5-like [Nylanderia fulva]|uniref:gem-associated protein 5-like n=1 Tax=Nylanderia fulva TaxID=613905 RepID=UPI0010FB1810|nr:gem-associated protein 5-like [Nylanderia fulva]
MDDSEHHKKEIVSLSWCPSDMNVLNGNNKRDLLLASGAKLRSVFIWRAGRDGKRETVINIPKWSHKQKPYRRKHDSAIWIAMCWVEPKVFLTSSLWNELLSWDLSTYKTKRTYQFFHKLHSNQLCSITAVPENDAISDNERAKSKLAVWTSAQDGWIICYKRNDDDMKSASLKYKIPTQEGFMYCKGADCDDNDSIIAFHVGDAMLHQWNLPEYENKKSFNDILQWQMLKGKITAVSLFPGDKLSKVAFGTGDGHIGIFNVNNTPLFTLYRQYHRNTIYKLEWAKLKEDFYLFSCAEGELVAFKKFPPHNESMSIIKEGCTEFAWKSNLCLAIGLENGSIMFYDQKLTKQYAIDILRYMVNCLAWHPESTATDKWKSPAANYLTVASDWTIIIFDMVNCLAWHPESTATDKWKSPAANYLTVASDWTIVIFDMSELIKDLERMLTPDCVEEEDTKKECKRHKMITMLNGHNNKVVWNVEKQELMSTYMGHNGPVLYCMWSLLKPQIIMTGYQSDTVLLKEKKENLYFNGYDKLINDGTKILNFIKNDIKLEQEQYEEDDNIANISLFSKKHLLKLVAHKQLIQDSSNAITEMNMWCNNLKNDLASAAKNKKLNDFLVSLASSVSMKTWKEMCETYLYQLIEQGNVKKAVSYLLCLHKIHEAIEAFLNANMFKEAYVLARYKLDITDPVLENILELWSEWCLLNDQMEQAAHWYKKAAKILARRKDIHYLEVASQLAFLNGDEEYGISLIVDAMIRALVESDWSKARSLIANFSTNSVTSNTADENDVYEKIEEEINKLKLEEKVFREERVYIPNSKVIFDKVCSLVHKLSNVNHNRFLHIILY